MTIPAVSTVYCDDEDVVTHAPSDFDRLVPPEWLLARGTDGAFAAGDRWVLTSAAATFRAAGVAAGQVVILKKGAGSTQALYGTNGTCFVIDAVPSETSLHLRRAGFQPHVGLPPGELGGTTGVEYAVKTLYPVIEDESYNINRRFGIDDKVIRRKAADLYDPRELEHLCVLSILARMYFDAWRKANDDVWLAKAKLFEAEKEDMLGRLVLRWGSSGNVQPPDTRFSTRISR